MKINRQSKWLTLEISLKDYDAAAKLETGAILLQFKASYISEETK
jgi:hypothetical protein